MNWVQRLDGMGRPLMRAIGVLVLAAVGFAIAAALIQWSVFKQQLPSLPGEALLLAALPYVNAAWDNWVRSTEKKTVIAFEHSKAAA